MEATPNDFRQHFELLSDTALLNTNREDLVHAARQCFDDEIARRGLDAAHRQESCDDARLVQIAKFHFRPEFEVAKALLRSEGIPATQGNRIGRRIELELPLMVPTAFAGEALELLRSRVSDEELDAQAEDTVPENASEEQEPAEESSAGEDV